MADPQVFYSENNTINAPDPAIEFKTDPPVLEDIFTNFWGNEDWGWDATFSVVDQDQDQNPMVWVVTDVTYNSSYDFITTETPADNTIRIVRQTNPFDEYFHLEQTTQGSVDKTWDDESEQFASDFTFDPQTPPEEIDDFNFNYQPPEEDLFEQETNRFEYDDVLEQDYVGVSRWELPDPNVIELVHSFAITADGYPTSGGVPAGTPSTTQTFSKTIYNEMHWNFDKSYITFRELLDNSAIQVAPDDGSTTEITTDANGAINIVYTDANGNVEEVQSEGSDPNPDPEDIPEF